MSTTKDWIPAKQEDFFSFQEVYMNTIGPGVDSGAFEIPEPPFDALVVMQDEYVAAWNVYITPATRTPITTNTKNIKLKIYKEGIRSFTAEHVRNNSFVPLATKLTVGLPDPDTEPTPSPIPTTNPVMQIDARDIARHYLHLKNEMPTTTKAKPEGVEFGEVCYVIGDTAPIGPEECIKTIIVKRSPKLVNFASEDRRKTAFYFARWVNTRGEAGPWSPGFSATIS